MALRLAFIGFNSFQTWLHFRDFIKENSDQVLGYSITGGGALLSDGTRVFIPPERLDRLDGLRIDQVIVARDSRGFRNWSWERLRLLDALVLRATLSAQVRVEDRVIFYELDEKEGQNA